MGKRKQIWLIHIVGKQKEIRDEVSVCILLVPINQEILESVVLIISICVWHPLCVRPAGVAEHCMPHFPFPPDELMSSVASEVRGSGAH